MVRYYPRALVGDGGITNAIRGWSIAMAEAGADVVVAYEGDQPFDGWSDVKGARVAHVGAGRVRVPRGLADVLDGSDVVVLHSGWVAHNLRAATVATRVGVPYVLEPRGAYDPHIVTRKQRSKKLWWAVFERRVIAGARGVHLFFDSEKPHLDALGYQGDFVVAPNGVRQDEGRAWDGGSGDFILWLGRFDPQHKGLDLLIEGLAMLAPDARPRLRLHGPDWRNKKADVVALVRKLGLRDWVHVGDPVYGDAKWELMSQATGFVYPSRWEGFGISVAEAASMGMPTLVTPYPLGQHLGERGGAFLVDATTDGLASGLRSVVGAEAPAVGQRGQQILRSEFTWDAVARSWLTQVEAML